VIGLYHRLPYPLRVVAASARGYQLRRWRYGAATDRWVEEALAADRRSPAEWRRWQDQRLQELLEHAVRRVPWYRERVRGDWTRLENWPVVEKHELRRRPEAFLADGCDPRRMYRVRTSGTTGTPLTVWSSRETVRRWYALYEARFRRWNGLDRSLRWGILGGQLVAPVRRQRPPFWVWNRGLNQLYLSTYHLSAETVPAYLDALARHRVEYLLGYPSALDVLARHATAAPRLRAVLSNAEPLYPSQRARIAAAFRCPVRDSYGMAEAVLGASECEAGSLHLWPEAGVPEVAADGRLLCTGLLNRDMPLIRYAVGDRAVLAPPDERCACGRGLPILLSIDGRCDDLIRTRDGRRIGRLDPVFKADLAVREAQIVQEALERIRVRVVADAGYGDRTREGIRRNLRERLGPVDVVVEEVDALPRGPNGKFRAVVSLLPADSPDVAGPVTPR